MKIKWNGNLECDVVFPEERFGGDTFIMISGYLLMCQEKWTK